MSLRERASVIVNGFSSTFWIANTLELFERLAYYGAKAVLTVFLATKVGLEKEAGFLAGLFNAVLYSLPIVAGVFVDKYGFKRTLMACFAIFCVGYFLIGLAGMEYGQAIVETVGKRNYVIGVLLLTAVGGSLIKPCIVGTVAKTSKPGAQALGFSIYYTLVNLGGAIGPIIAFYVRQDLGIEFVLVMSSITSLLLFFGAWLFFKEPDGEVGEKKTFAKVFSDMVLVFANIKFMSFLLIFSGFWMMFWQVFYTLPFYATNVLHYEAFEFLETVDAWTIIIITIPVTAFVSKWKPVVAIIIGFTIASASWIVIGAGGTILFTVIGIMLFALGEATQAPRFYEYVSSLAPKGQVGTFMGFAFLPVAIGSFTAGILSDWLRSSYLDTDPAMMWYTLSGIGFTSTALMIVYNLVVKKSN
ncbi:MAG: MFS transporter [Cytophagales bacterium]|jgi:dipeptide/tripeptide permease|nr:MFS transporter [Cytophagales bacterium]MCA6367380.1 MFS transporter [Cytophagales bacterium]MCA6371737.1 MFS transporter [Cytophagales bacterium]MCA6376135.1 MFS transporter [Cytophagales bacterium]MCA6383955.1 MFS transporter [Cytophagales bacterium]